MEEIRQKFEQYRKESDPSIAISDEQADWVLQFIKKYEDHGNNI